MKWLREAKKWTEKEQDILCEQAMKKFGPKFWCKPGYEWGEDAPIFWTGESAIMPDGSRAYNYFAEDYEEKTYIFGVHKDLIAWAESKGVSLENHDAGTLFGYPV